MALELLKNPGIGSCEAQLVSASALHLPAAGAFRIPSRVVPVTVAIVLIGAGLLKTEQLWNEGSSEPTLVGSWGLALLIQFELGLGLALAANLAPRLLRSIALVLFAAFAGLAASKAISGASSCSCLGSLKTSPMLAILADLSILAALWRWRPEHRPGSTWLKVAFTVSLLAVAPWPLVAAFRPAAYPRLVVTPLIDLGQLAPGKLHSFALRLHNPHDQTVEIVALESSCPCLEAKRVPSRVAPGQKHTLDMVLDLSHEPAFSGQLSVLITGRTGNGHIAFSTRVAISVSVQPILSVTRTLQ